jgi:hypothetical protein
MPTPRRAAVVAAIVAFVALSSPARAEVVLTDRVTVDPPVDASCTTAIRTSGGGVAQRAITAPATGYLTARLNAVGEWDLAVFRDGDPEPVAGSAYRGALEVAAGYVTRDERLTVQACRRSGRGTTAELTLELERSSLSSPAGPVSLVRVSTPTELRKNDLLALDLDVTENGGPGFVDVVLYGPGDAARLRDAGFTFTSVVGAAPGGASALPSGRAQYRRLHEVTEELHSLADQNPDIVKPIQLPHLSGEGRRIEGIEITTNPRAIDGKPVFLMLGMHHAREWPSVEVSMEWARELIDGFRSGDPRTVDLLGRLRMIVVPVVNADGYNDSREAGHVAGNDDGSGDPFSGTQYRRKNCRLPNDEHHCTSNDGFGVDPNRNYAGFWGGIGSSSLFEAGTFRGSNPFSEPDTENVRRLVSARQVVLLITNHTSGRKILRQPGIASLGPSIDEIIYKGLGSRFAAENGYINQFSKQLYDHGGTTDAWSYYATRGLAYVFELNTSFHGRYQELVDEFDGTASGAGGNREAYFKGAEWAADPAGHAVLTGTTEPGAILRLTKTFSTTTQVGINVPDRLDTIMQVPASGEFEWHVNPSTRPLLAIEGKRESWTLTCEYPAGTVRKSQPIFAGRGERLRVAACPPDVGPIRDLPVVPPPDEFAP